MIPRHELTVRKFERKHPDVSLSISENSKRVCVVAREMLGVKRNSFIARRRGPTGSLNRLLWELSEAIQAIRRLEVAKAQGYRDSQTGEIKPLQIHHVQFRSHGGTHERSNLTGIGAESHRKIHEDKGDSRKT